MLFQHPKGVGGTWADKYIGIPFVERGATFKGCNCWGLVALVLKTECSIVVPTYEEILAMDGRAARDAMNKAAVSDDWVPVLPHSLQPFDVVRMRSAYQSVGVWLAANAHVGILYDDKRCLHVEDGINAVCMGLSHPAICERVTGFFRHRELA